MFTAPAQGTTDPNPPYGAPAISFTAAALTPVQAGTNYWFQISPSSDTAWITEQLTQTNVFYGWEWLWMTRSGNDNPMLVATNASPGVGDWTAYSEGYAGGLVVTGTAIPEPSTVAIACGLAALGLVMWRRRAVETKS